MNFERQKRLVERLLDRTRAGEMPWEEAPDDEAFQLLLSKNRIQINKEDDDGFARYQIMISDDQDIVTDVFSDVQLERDGSREISSWGVMMQEIYMLARRRSLKSDEVLENILMEIG